MSYIDHYRMKSSRFNFHRLVVKLKTEKLYIDGKVLVNEI